MQGKSLDLARPNVLNNLISNQSESTQEIIGLTQEAIDVAHTVSALINFRQFI